MKTGDMIEDRIKQRVSKFWILTRYYEIEDYKQNNQVQTISQRIGRALLFIPLLMAMVLGGFSIFIKSQVLERLHMNISNISVLNSMAESNITQINESQKALLSAEIILPYVSHTLLSLLFFAFIVVCISRSKFVRLHNALKVLIFYNGLSFVIPIKTIRLYGILYSYDLSMESFLCFMSLVPFSFAFPILFYLFSHYPYKHIGDVVNSIKDIRQLISNFGNSTKLHKFLNTLMIIFGLSGLFLLLLSLFLPWVTIEFYPSKELKQISKAFEGAHNSILNILNSISSSNVIKFQTSLDKFKPLFKSPILTFVYKFKLDIHIILFLLPCFLFGMVCCAIGFWRRHSLEGVSSHFILSAIAFTFFVSNIAVWFLIFFFKSLFYAVLRLAPLIDPRVNEEVGLKMMKIAFTFSSIAAMILWLKTTGSFIVSLVRWIIKKSCTKRNRVNMYAKQENKMAILSSNDEISTMDRAVGVNVITLPENEHSAKDCKIEMKPFKIKSKLSSPTTWVMSLFPAIVSSIIIIYIIIERPEMFTANPELTGQLRSLITETKERSNGISVNRMKRDISLAGKTIQIFKRSAPDNITEFISGLNMTFLGDKSFDIGGFIYALNILMPFLSTILVFLGFILTSLPCLKLKHKKKIAGTFVCWLLRLIVASLSFSQSIMGLIKIIFARVPFFRLNLEEGPAVPLITAVNIVLLLSWIELRISKCKPLL
ncbi:hypothetical protein KUTeg_022008 [Tegillarca granosa]|uniref:Uncharacterized protein n=1 Tax=Tegillarca granosa TaxID=220873 RepID=A0ABQ9E576_TEGGR|nr:hypothetical protein KUTeg_022008 [Tegillarca granosa]